MNWTFVLVTASQRDMRALDEALQRRIIEAIRRYTSEGLGDVVKLKGRQEEWRLRVGDYRVRFRRDAVKRVLVILRVLHRSAAYR